MNGKLLFLMIFIPLLDLYLVFKVAHWINFWPTVFLVVMTGFWGHSQFKRQGMNILMAARQELMSGRMPTQKIISGMMVLVGGVLLMTPGFLTDLVGVLLLIPGMRRIAITWLNKKFEIILQNKASNIHVYHHESFIEREP